jgi:hypothetical protein
MAAKELELRLEVCIQSSAIELEFVGYMLNVALGAKYVPSVFNKLAAHELVG